MLVFLHDERELHTHGCSERRTPCKDTETDTGENALEDREMQRLGAPSGRGEQVALAAAKAGKACTSLLDFRENITLMAHSFKISGI